MKNINLLLLVVVTLCPPMKAQAQTVDVPLPSQKLGFTVSRKVELPYLYYLPKDYKPKSKQQWPLMLFLHGAGERGTNVQRVAIHGPMSLVKQGKEFPFIIVAPLCPEKERWQNDSLLKLLENVTRKYSVDTNRVYLTGLSMGGYGTWRLALENPEKFAAVVPICGGGEMISIILAKNYETNRLASLKGLGIWAFHGGQDPVVPLDESERIVAALKKNGCSDVKLTVYPQAQHNSWTETYKNPELYDWLLRHKR